MEGPVADGRTSAFPAILLWLTGSVSWEVAEAGRAEAGAGPAAGRVAQRYCPAPSIAPFPGVAGAGASCQRQLSGYPAGRDWWGGDRDVGGVLPRINIGTRLNVWGESSIMTGVYERWCSSTLHIGWGLCDCLCLVLVCRGRYSLGGCFFTSFCIEFGWSRTSEGSSEWRKRGVV